MHLLLFCNQIMMNLVSDISAMMVIKLLQILKSHKDGSYCEDDLDNVEPND